MTYMAGQWVYSMPNPQGIAQRPGTTLMYQLNNTLLKSVSSNPYLGILFSDRLTCNQHTNNITKKANSTLRFIRRNLRWYPTACKKTAYLALVRPLLEYGAIIWDPYQKQDISKMERIQRNAVRFIAKDYKSKTPGSVTRLLTKHDLPTLQERREDLRLTFLYKVVGGLVPAVPPEKYLTPQKTSRNIRPPNRPDYIVQNPVHNQSRNHDRCLEIPSYNTLQYNLSSNEP